MTIKQQMLAAINGEPTDSIPYVPRLDLWFRANRRAGTLPEKYRDATLIDLIDDLGIGYHGVVPNFRDLRNPDDDVDRVLGIYNLWSMPCRTVLENVDRNVCVEGDRTFVDYHTPEGTLNTVVLFDESMRKAGITITHVEKPAFIDTDNYAALGYIFEHARVEPNYAGYTEFADRIGDRGLAMGFVSLAGSPMHLIQRELMPLDTFFFETHDHPDELAHLADQIGMYWDRLLTVASDCPAEVVFIGANYDATVTYPPFFADHIGPWLKKAADMLHERGKFLLTHTDGENTGLLEHYLAADIDIADSICPRPMTKLSIAEVRDTFAGKITIMGGVPSVSLLPSSMHDDQFEAFVDEFFDQLGVGDHLILGISDTTPPAADFDRIVALSQRARAFGPVTG